MSEHEPEALSPDLAALLARTRDGEDVPSDASERLLARVHATIVQGGAEGGSGGAPATPATGGIGRHLPFRLTRSGLALFAAGALSGAAAHRALSRPPPPRIVVVTREVERVVHDPAPLPQPAMAPPTGSPPPAGPSRETRSATEAPIVATEPSAASERALIATAQTALNRGRADAALAPLERHARMFPTGRYAEERESLWVQCLVALGHDAQARARAQRFRQRFPQSLFLPAVEESLRSIP